MSRAARTDSPPWFPRFLLSVFLPFGEVGEMIRGDLEEEFRDLAELDSLEGARSWYRRQAMNVVTRFALARALRRTGRWLSPGPWLGRPGSPLRNSVHDVRYGLRVLVREPTFSIVAILALALGIGANTAIFSVIDAVILRPLPFEQPERVVQIWDQYPSYGLGDAVSLSEPNYRDYRDRNEVFEHFAAILPNDFYTADTDALETVSGLHVSPDFFAIMGMAPATGRLLLPQDNDADAARVAVLTYDYWQRAFGGSADVVGESLKLRIWRQRRWDPIELEIVGILPPDFEVPPLRIGTDYRVWSHPDFLVPISLWEWGRGNRGMYSLHVLAQLKEGVKLEQARANLESIASGIAAEYPETNEGYTAVVTPVGKLLRDQYGTGLFFLWAATALVLLIACANVASLLLGRAVMRERELAVRATLGAGRLRLLRQLLTESALLGFFGGLLGLVLAYWGSRVLRAFTPGEVHRIAEASIDLRVLLFSMGATILTVLLFGLVPAIRGTRPDLMASLKSGVRGVSVGRLRSLRALVVAEVAMSLVLLVGAGLMLGSFWNVAGVDPGFEREDVLLIKVQMPDRLLSKYGDREAQAQLFYRIREHAESLPGVVSLAATYSPPLSGAEGLSDVTMADRPAPAPSDRRYADWRQVTPGYFKTVGTPLLAGRTFREEELQLFIQGRTDPARWAVPVSVIVNESMARHFWPDESPLGKRFYWGIQDPEIVPQTLQEGEWSELWDSRYPQPLPLSVIGVVADVKTIGLEHASPLQYYTLNVYVTNLLVRTGSDPVQMAEMLRTEIEAVDPQEISVSSIRTMAEIFSEATAESRFRAALVGLFAALAAALTALGLFGVLAYAVRQRAHEIGVRMSLGAERGDISRLILGQGLKLSLAGIAIGLLVSFWSMRYVSNLLFGVTPTDPVTLLGAAVLICGLALTACYLPARRASRFDPMAVLRQD